MERFAVLVVLLVLVGGSRGGAQTPLLEPADGSPFDVSGSSGQVLLADVNDDGHLDLLTRHQQASLSSSAPAEHFPRARQSSFRAGPGAFDVAIGDVNADRRPDVVASSFESNAVTVLLGR